MGTLIQTLAMIGGGILLLWFGYSLFFGRFSPYLYEYLKKKKMDDDEVNELSEKGIPGDPQVCPVCSVKLMKGEKVKTHAFPSVTGGKERLMYIRGCYRCLNRNMARRCPICKVPLTLEDYLVARMSAHADRKSHIHVLGCNNCKEMGTLERKTKTATHTPTIYE